MTNVLHQSLVICGNSPLTAVRHRHSRADNTCCVHPIKQYSNLNLEGPPIRILPINIDLLPSLLCTAQTEDAVCMCPHWFICRKLVHTSVFVLLIYPLGSGWHELSLVYYSFPNKSFPLALKFKNKTCFPFCTSSNIKDENYICCYAAY